MCPQDQMGNPSWEDKVHYLDRTTFAGTYSESVVLDDDTILTVAGYSDGGTGWDSAVGNTHFRAIRWRPVNDR